MSQQSGKWRPGYTDLAPGQLAAVVTYLEMREPPVLPPLASPEFSLRRVVRADPAWYRKLFRDIGEPWLWFSRLRLDDSELTAILHDPSVDVFALQHNGQDKGLLELDRRQFPDIELAFFGVTTGLIGKGAGRFLMRRALEIAWSHAPARFWLHTCTLDHPRALEFYLKSGFTAYKRSIEVMEDPRLTGGFPPAAAPHVPIL